MSKCEHLLRYLGVRLKQWEEQRFREGQYLAGLKSNDRHIVLWRVKVAEPFTGCEQLKSYQPFARIVRNS